MLKLKFITVSIFLSSIVFFSSCSKEWDNSNQVDEDIVAKSLVFKYYDLNLTKARGENYYISPSTGKLVIVNWTEWGRGSRDCRSWGLCNASWFYFESDRPLPIPTSGYSAPLEVNSVTGEYYLEVLLGENPKLPGGVVPDLKVDSDIALETSLDIGRDLILKTGSYSFNPNLGDFGGIHITLE